MQRRVFVAAGLLAPLAVRAHHGWSSFDQTRPLWLEGRAAQVSWRNPHVEFKLEVAPDLKLPVDLAARKLPAQTAAVDGPALLRAEIKTGQTLAVLGFGFAGEKGQALLRAEYLFMAGQVYGLRSGPA